MLDKGALTAHGLQFIEKSLDPFHDTELGAVDFPDGRSQRVVVKEVNQSITLSNPGAIWDCHIAVIPDLFRDINNTTSAVTDASALFSDKMSPGLVDQRGAMTSMGGGVAYSIVSTGAQTFVPGGSNAPSVSPGSQITGRSRVVGMAFEVHNVTEELYRSGSVTCYRTASGREMDCVQFAPETAEVQTVGPLTINLGFPRPTIRRSMPPNTEAEALILPGSRQWGAERGCYVVGVLDDPDVEYKSWDTVPRVYTSAYDFVRATPANPTTGAAHVSTPVYVLDTAGTLTLTSPASTDQSFDTVMRQSGAYFTGLSTQTKLRLNVKYLIACQPDSDDPLVTLAKPGGAADNLALEIYSRCVEKLPPGVPVSENAAGDWFRGLLGVVSQVAPIVGSAFGPAGAAIGNAVGTAARAGQAALGPASGGSGGVRPLRQMAVMKKATAGKAQQQRKPLLVAKARARA